LAAQDMTTPRERAEERRQAKLDLIREQVESGALVIRSMSDAERLANPPRTPPAARARRYPSGVSRPVARAPQPRDRTQPAQ
jgi:hypothetical protein